MPTQEKTVAVPGAPTAACSVAWLGEAPDVVPAGAGFDVRVVPREASLGAAGTPDAIHVAVPASLPSLHRRYPDASLVLDLRASGPRLGWRAGRDARAADAIVLGSLHELREFRRLQPELADRASVVRRPIDLEAHAPLALLKQSRDTELKRFRRFHRLAGPVVLFAGPYTEAGGLDRAVDLAHRLREERPDVSLAAIPDGPVDRRYLDRCERAVLDLGHHGIVEWTCPPSDAPLWYGLATVVILPCRDAVVSTAATLAAAAARPFVGSRVATLADEVVDGRTGRLVAVSTLDELQAAVDSLLDDAEEATRLGEAARARVEAECAPDAVARGLAQVWRQAVAPASAPRGEGAVELAPLPQGR
jgi:glycosyltransferase involved in cell wall biosynthesis